MMYIVDSFGTKWSRKVLVRTCLKEGRSFLFKDNISFYTA